MFFTPERLLVLALAVTLLAADGVRRVRQQRRSDEIDRRTGRVFLAILIAGSVLAWTGFLVVWMRN